MIKKRDLIFELSTPASTFVLKADTAECVYYGRRLSPGGSIASICGSSRRIFSSPGGGDYSEYSIQLLNADGGFAADFKFVRAKVTVEKREIPGLPSSYGEGRTLEPAAYWQQWVLCAGGILLVAPGVSFEVAAKVITLAGEGLVLALCALFPRARFGYVKIGVDCSFVVIAVLLSFVFLHELTGVREGTLAAAVFVGLIAKQFNRFMVPFADSLFRPFAAKREN